MSLRGQERVENGYAMAALLVALAVMSVLMSVALPVWRHDAQREKEEELVFRGQQYVRAIRLYQMRMQSLPPSIDVLVTGRYIRKKFKDPITDDDFEVIPAGGGQPVPGAPQQGAPGRGGPAGGSQPVGGFAPQQPSGSGGTVMGGIMGVRSKSKAESIRLYQNRNHYNEWAFLYVQPAPVGGPGRGGPGGAPGRGGPVGPGGRPGGPGGRGVGPGRGGPGDGRRPFPFPGPGRGGRGGL